MLKVENHKGIYIKDISISIDIVLAIGSPLPAPPFLQKVQHINDHLMESIDKILERQEKIELLATRLLNGGLDARHCADFLRLIWLICTPVFEFADSLQDVFMAGFLYL